MKSSTTTVKGRYRRDFSWIECVIHSPGKSRIRNEKLEKLNDIFGKVTVLTARKKPTDLLPGISWTVYDSDLKGSVEQRNLLMGKATKDWVLFLEAGEEICFYHIPEENKLSPEMVVPAVLNYKDEKSNRTVYQVRLVHKSTNYPFKGYNLADATHCIVEKGKLLYDRPFEIHCQADPLDQIDTDKEIAVLDAPPAAYLLKAEQLMMERKYVQAAAQYRNILKIEKLLPFDRLGAVNGLTRCYTEQYKWPKAMQLAQKSLDAEPVQRIPYLIEYRIHQLNKQWAEAYEALKLYYEHIDETGRASYDRAMPEEDVLEQLGELATKAGHKHDAFQYLEEIYSEKVTGDDKHLLRKLLMVAIELGKRERSIYYFNKMFEQSLPDNLTSKEKLWLDDYMTLFMNNQWYTFAGEIYEELYKAEPENPEYRRRLIVALSKTDRIERARKLIAS